MVSDDSNPRLLTDREVGVMLGISWRTVRRLVETDPIFPRPLKLGRCVRWDLKRLDEYLARKTREADRR
ncbi:MAG: helix-turn-helix transcriptional regulator [Gemmataceae bacterium]